MRIVQSLQRKPLVQHPRARRRVEQLGGRHPQPDRSGAHPAAGRPLQRLHHRRGAHALPAGVQRIPQNARRTARTRGIHPCDDRKAQDYPDDPLAMPDLRFQPHPGRGRGGVSQIHRFAGGRYLRRRIAAHHRPKGRRRDARRAVDVRQGGFVLRIEPHDQRGRRHTERTRLRHLFHHHATDSRG